MFPEERSLVEDMQGRPFVLLGINTDDELSVAQESVKSNKLNWRSFYDGRTSRITGMFGIKAFPTVMLINHNGQIEYSNLRGKKLIPEIKRLVKAAEADGMEGEKIAAEMRTFRDRTGKHRIEAIAVGRNGDQIKLRKKDGKTVTMSLVDLSRTDQDYLRTVDLPESNEEPGPDAFDRSEYRTFVDSTGKHKIEAVFVNMEDDKVTLQKRDGSTVTLDLDKLSDEDQEFVQRRDSGF